MNGNGDFAKYFDALNKRLDVKFDAIDKRFDALNKQLEVKFDAIDKRFETIEETLKAHGEAITSLQDSQALVLKTMTAIANAVKRLDERVISLEGRVGRLEERSERIEQRLTRVENGIDGLIKMVTDIRGLESGKPLELKEVRYDEVAHTLTGIVREKKVKYGRKKK